MTRTYNILSNCPACRDSSPKIIYSASCRSKPVLLSFLWAFLTDILKTVFDHIMKVNGVQNNTGCWTRYRLVTTWGWVFNNKLHFRVNHSFHFINHLVVQTWRLSKPKRWFLRMLIWLSKKGERGRGREGEEVCVCCATRDSKLPLNVSITAPL